jgi:hypothetical protein
MRVDDPGKGGSGAMLDISQWKPRLRLGFYMQKEFIVDSFCLGKETKDIQ